MATVYKPNPRVGWRSIGEDVIAYSCDSHIITVWNEAGALIWMRLAPKGATLHELTECLCAEYDVPAVTAEHDARSFLSTISEEGFISGEQWNDMHRGSTQEAVDTLLMIERIAIQHRIPYSVVIESTFTCNARCIHCYMEQHGAMLSLEELQHLFHALARSGTLFLTLTGGEFFTRPDAVEILRAAAEAGFVIDILSNGTRIDETIIAALRVAPVRRVQLSLYGSTADRHDAITRRTGSFTETLRAIYLLRAAKIKVECAMPLFRTTIDDAEQTRALVERLGCGFLPNHLIIAKNDGGTEPCNLRLSDAQLREYFERPRIAALYRGRRPFAEHQYYLGASDLQSTAPCYSGYNTCAIRPNGDVVPCNQFLYVLGNVRTQSFEEIWEKSPALQHLRSIKVQNLTTCRDCALLPHCARCPGVALLEAGDMLAASPEHCRITRITAEVAERRDTIG